MQNWFNSLDEKMVGNIMFIIFVSYISIGILIILVRLFFEKVNNKNFDFKEEYLDDWVFFIIFILIWAFAIFDKDVRKDLKDSSTKALQKLFKPSLLGRSSKPMFKKRRRRR